MAVYKTLPHYELKRPGIDVKFDIDGYYHTEKQHEIEYLDTCKPFIQRIDTAEQEPKKSTKPKAQPKKK